LPLCQKNEAWGVVAGLRNTKMGRKSIKSILNGCSIVVVLVKKPCWKCFGARDADASSRGNCHGAKKARTVFNSAREGVRWLSNLPEEKGKEKTGLWTNQDAPVTVFAANRENGQMIKISSAGYPILPAGKNTERRQFGDQSGGRGCERAGQGAGSGDNLCAGLSIRVNGVGREAIHRLRSQKGHKL